MNVTINTPAPIHVEFQTPTSINVKVGVPDTIKVLIGGIIMGNGENWVINEEPSGLINGTNATFTTAFNFVAGKAEVYLNGMLQKIVQDYQSIGNNTIQINTSPSVGETILISYIKL